MLAIIFWLSFFVIVYVYIGYPLLLAILGFWRTDKTGLEKGKDIEPDVSVIIPVYNEESVISQKISNTLELDYRETKLEIIVISDGSTDNTRTILQKHVSSVFRFFELPERTGKAAALNLGLQKANNEIIVFTDASIFLDKDALRNLLHRFSDSRIGCVSGEDYIPGGGGEGAYGRYEIFLRNLESRLGSIVGASGCFYAQRKSLCEPFPEGMAPDFFSVLKTAEKGFRVVTEPSARGFMGSVQSQKGEFQRKIRTYLRGITTLMRFKHLLNPFRYGLFAIQLISHKMIRWWVGIFLILLFVSSLFLISSKVYAAFFLLQIVFYCLAAIGWMGVSGPFMLRIPFFFSMVNLSALIAWAKYCMGFRQEIWEPSKR